MEARFRYSLSWAKAAASMSSSWHKQKTQRQLSQYQTTKTARVVTIWVEAQTCQFSRTTLMTRHLYSFNLWVKSSKLGHVIQQITPITRNEATRLLMKERSPPSCYSERLKRFTNQRTASPLIAAWMLTTEFETFKAAEIFSGLVPTNLSHVMHNQIYRNPYSFYL